MKQNHQNDAAIETFRATYKDLDHTFSLFSKACGLSDAEYWALVMIRDGVCTQRDISEQLSMSKQTVNSAFRQLIKKGLVRLETVENNLRTKRIFLTDSGIQFAEQHIDSILRLEEQIWDTMTEEERSTLTKLTRKYNDLMKSAFEQHQQTHSH